MSDGLEGRREERARLPALKSRALCLLGFVADGLPLLAARLGIAALIIINLRSTGGGINVLCMTRGFLGVRVDGLGLPGTLWTCCRSS